MPFSSAFQKRSCNFQMNIVLLWRKHLVRGMGDKTSIIDNLLHVCTILITGYA